MEVKVPIVVVWIITPCCLIGTNIHTYIHTYIHKQMHTCTHTHTKQTKKMDPCVTKTKGCGKSHNNANIHNFYSVKYNKHFTKQ